MNSVRHLAYGAALSALLCGMSSAVYAQETTSSVRGEVTGAEGPIANAGVVIVHTPSGTRSTTSTNSSGVFDARGLRVGGPYTVTVTAPNRPPRTIEGLILAVGQTERVDVAFDEVEELVITGTRDVTADNSGVRSTLSRVDVDQVVSVTRDVRDLARRNALVSQNSRGDSGISIAGSNPRTNRITIDGTQAQDDFGLNTGGLPTRRGPVSLDAIEQFSVSAVPIDVENGDFTGGALDVVLRSGNNDFHGSAFINYLNDGMVGRKIRGRRIASAITQDNYGAFLSGPILQDRLFFALSYEKYKTADTTSFGPVGAGFANDIRGVTQAQIDGVINTFNNVYASDFDTGNVVRTLPIKDEKYSIKLDWNINDNHRLSFTNRYALSELRQRTNLNSTSAGLDSQWYLTGEEDYAYVLDLNSQWTDNFSTQIRATHRDYERRQEPPSGQEFADITVCLAPTTINSGGDTLTGCGPTSVVRFGPDQFRHANFLETLNSQIQAKAEWSLGNHLIKFGYQGQRQKVFNIFVPNSDGTYYFDSLADFTAGRANRLIYQNATTGVAEDAAAAFKYYVHSAFIQDKIEVTDDLTITAGFRYDWYQSDDKPANNPNFATRQGFSNQTTYDGKGVMMPRVSFEYEPTTWVKVNGGAGLFSGGFPDVLLSNSYSNTGFLTSGIQIERNADGTFRETTGAPGFTQAIGAAALNINVADPRFGYDIPAAVNAFQGGALVPPTNEVNAFLPSFRMPSDWKYFLSVTFTAEDGWAESWAGNFAPVFDDWRFTIDAVYTDVNNGLLFKDFRATPLLVNGQQQRTPDGRLRYDGVGGTTAQRAAFGITSTNPGSNRDIITLNTDRGETTNLAFTLQRDFDFGLGLLFSYAYQDQKDMVSGGRFGSTANSLYGGGAAGLDPNEEAYGTSFEEIKHRYKFEASYRKSFFKDLFTSVNLFGEVRSGRPINWVMNDPASGRGTTFGVNRGNMLLYVPDFRADPNPNDLTVGFVTFDSVATRDNFRRVVEQFGLPQGQIVPKGGGSNDQPEIYQVDLQLAQDLPTLIKGHKFQVILDVQNVLNLINNKWGLIEEYTDANRVISAQCADANGVAAPTGSPVCTTYRYTNFNPTAETKNLDNNGRSLWAVQVRLRYQF